MKNILILGSRAMLVSLAVFAGAACAQALKSTEVRGVSLGMSQSEAEAALKVNYPNYLYVRQMPAGGKFSPKLAVNPRPGTQSPVESFVVDFGPATGRAVVIERTVFSNTPGLAIEPLKAGLEQKYGVSIDSRDDQIYGRATDASNKPESRCYTKFYGPVATGRPRGMAECGQSLKVTVKGKVAEGVYQEYTLKLIDHQAEIKELRDASAQDAAEQQQSGKRAQDAARGVKPQL